MRNGPFEKEIILVNFALIKFIAAINDSRVYIFARHVKTVTVRKWIFNKWTSTVVCLIIHCSVSSLNVPVE